MNRYLLVDANALCYRSFYAHTKLKTRFGAETGMIYTFFSTLKTIAERLNCCRWAFFWDSKTSFRKDLYPDYKGNREKSKEVLEAYQQFDMLRKTYLPRCGFANNFIKKGLEADDLIASVCINTPPQEDEEYYILSADKDLYQLITKHISMLSVKKALCVIYGYGEFVEEFGIRPKDWKEVKALAGCATDNIKGLPRVRERTAVNFVSENKAARGVKKISELLEQEEYQKIVELNRKLTTLPFEGTPALDLDWNKKPNPEAFFELCEKLEFNSFLNKRKAWESILNGKRQNRLHPRLV